MLNLYYGFTFFLFGELYINIHFLGKISVYIIELHYIDSCVLNLYVSNITFNTICCVGKLSLMQRESLTYYCFHDVCFNCYVFVYV